MSASDTPDVPTPSFRELKLLPALLKALDEVGYETPTPIQAQAVPHLLNGLDLLGHAPTGTGKTGAFALPLISRLDLSNNSVQILTLTPTRELAIQVAEAFQRYAAHVKGFHVLPVYGGKDIGHQLQALRRGVHVVVGTPGRVMDHMRRGTLKLDQLQALVLDEADEMLRMGFIDDVQWILEKAPPERQMALFSATMPKEIERIAQKHLRSPQEISIKSSTATAETIRQRYWLVGGLHKLDALTRILEVEDGDGILIFVRTKRATEEIAGRLEARGYAAAAMNGDMAQKQREQMVGRFKKGSLDILVATDVAARGLDVDRISHVINYDIPYDTEAYIHRIGRTGRAGRTGDAILFVSPRERRMLKAIERATRQPIELLELPSTEMVNNKRINDFKQRITDTLAEEKMGFARSIVEQYQQEHDVPALDIAAALARITIGEKSLLLETQSRKPAKRHEDSAGFSDERPTRASRGERPERKKTKRKANDAREDMEWFRLEVGEQHGVEARNIAGAIANEAGLDFEYIGKIDINEEHSLVELPAGMPRSILKDLKKAWVCGRQLNASRVNQAGDAPPKRRKNIKTSNSANPAQARSAKPNKSTGKAKGKPAGNPKKGSSDKSGTAGPTKTGRKRPISKKVGKPS